MPFICAQISKPRNSRLEAEHEDNRTSGLLAPPRQIGLARNRPHFAHSVSDGPGRVKALHSTNSAGFGSHPRQSWQHRSHG
ncbi:hypothetical protein RRG08_045170 [Elysia crispata]|uniref:Uncharacterized protein n=1 Tax=Elysia crispata TaxID=231223 RepID=A0AAE1DWA8_9GAST|nr:hypothetical protein RRG08_045170 [Elysia crispata]